MSHISRGMSVAPLLISEKVFSTTSVRRLLILNLVVRLGLKWSSRSLMSRRDFRILLSSSMTTDETVSWGLVSQLWYSLNSITDSAGQSKNGWRGNVLHHLLTSQLPSPITHRFSPPHITMIYPSYALQRHTNYLKSRWVKWGTGEQCMFRVSLRKKCETWQQRTVQELCP